MDIDDDGIQSPLPAPAKLRRSCGGAAGLFALGTLIIMNWIVSVFANHMGKPASASSPLAPLGVEQTAPRIPVEKIAEASFPSVWGKFRICGFRLTDESGSEEAVVLIKGTPQPGQVPLVRIHSQCLTGDVFGSLRCDCREQLEMALERVGKSDYGFIIYEEKEGRGIGLMNKLQAYALQDQGLDTVEANERLGFEADLRDYRLPAGILQYYGVSAVRMLSNNPEKLRALEASGIAISERVPVEAVPHHAREKYLRTKREKMGHKIADRPAK